MSDDPLRGIDFDVRVKPIVHGWLMEVLKRDEEILRLRTALEHIAWLRKDGTPHDEWSNRDERIAREALGLPNAQPDPCPRCGDTGMIDTSATAEPGKAIFDFCSCQVGIELAKESS